MDTQKPIFGQPIKPVPAAEMPYSGTFPRAKHSHRCKSCGEGGYCYKSQCKQPQRIEMCACCRWKAGKP